MLSHSLKRLRKKQFGYHYSNKQRVWSLNKFRKELCDDISVKEQPEHLCNIKVVQKKK